jgi:hypothetical protein
LLPFPQVLYQGNIPVKKQHLLVGETVMVTKDTFPYNIGRIGIIVSINLDEPFAYYLRFESGLTDVVLDAVRLTPLLEALC